MLMDTSDYQIKIQEIGFNEFPEALTGGERSLGTFIPYEDTDLDLKIYLTEMIIRRCFSVTGVYCLPLDTEWLINGFLLGYENDLLRPWLTNTIREAILMVNSEDTFVKEIIGATFLFGIIENYAKYQLGYRPLEHDFFNETYHDSYRKMYLGDAINRLKKKNASIARSLNLIDKHNLKIMKSLEAIYKKPIEGRWIRPRIADRLSLARNAMLHGETHSFYGLTKYLVVLYILFHLHRQKEITTI